MFSEEIEAFRNKKGLSVKEFCEVSRIIFSRYSKYQHGYFRFLMIADAVRLLAAFSGEIRISTLLKWTDQRPLSISRDFPEFAFSCDDEADYERSDAVFRQFYIQTVYDVFPLENSIDLLAAMAPPWDRSVIGLPVLYNMYSLMYTLRKIRKIRFSGFSIPAHTVQMHFQRRRLITRFTDLCEYERAFESGGLYLLSELMYLSDRRRFGIRLCG